MYSRANIVNFHFLVHVGKLVQLTLKREKLFSFSDFFLMFSHTTGIFFLPASSFPQSISVENLYAGKFECQR